MDLIGTDWDTLFSITDDFCLAFEPQFQRRLVADGTRQRRRATRLSTSEIITILVAFQLSRFRDFKAFYRALCLHHRGEFPGLLSYRRFVALIPRVSLPLFAMLMALRGKCTGISFIDSTVLRVCHIKRASRNRVFRGLAAKSKSTMGWFFGFKLHLLVNDRGELLAFRLTPGNVDDRTPVKEGMLDEAWGKVFADKGYISQSLFKWLMGKGVKLVAGLRKNMKGALMSLEEKVLLRKRSISETVNDHLKNVCQIEHSRHRSPANFLTHLMAGLLAYTLLPAKPAIRTNTPNTLPEGASR